MLKVQNDKKKTVLRLFTYALDRSILIRDFDSLLAMPSSIATEREYPPFYTWVKNFRLPVQIQRKVSSY